MAEALVTLVHQCYQCLDGRLAMRHDRASPCWRSYSWVPTRNACGHGQSRELKKANRVRRLCFHPFLDWSAIEFYPACHWIDACPTASCCRYLWYAGVSSGVIGRRCSDGGVNLTIPWRCRLKSDMTICLSVTCSVPWPTSTFPGTSWSGQRAGWFCQAPCLSSCCPSLSWSTSLCCWLSTHWNVSQVFRVGSPSDSPWWDRILLFDHVSFPH